jgi:hypothetical protein
MPTNNNAEMRTISGLKPCNKGGRATFRLHYTHYAAGLRQSDDFHVLFLC